MYQRKRQFNKPKTSLNVTLKIKIYGKSKFIPFHDIIDKKLPPVFKEV